MGQLIINYVFYKSKHSKSRELNKGEISKHYKLIKNLDYNFTNDSVKNEEKGLFFKKLVGKIAFTIIENAENKAKAQSMFSVIDRRIKARLKNHSLECAKNVWSYVEE